MSYDNGYHLNTTVSYNYTYNMFSNIKIYSPVTDGSVSAGSSVAMPMPYTH